MNKGLIVLAIGSIVAAVFSFYQLSQHRKKKAVQQDNKAKKQGTKSNLQASTNTSKNSVASQMEYLQNQQQPQDRQLYQNQIIETHPYKIVLKKPIYNPDIDSLSYNVILNLNKSKRYEGIIKMKIISNKTPLNNKNLYIDTIASTILLILVNRKRIPQQQIFFRNHQILIKKQWLNKIQNHIQIIFSNNYAFMGDGLTCYFPLDQFNKYSLKSQVIYVRNGFYKTARIFPCLNILNTCQISLQVLHPNGFNTQSNNHKIEMKIATKKDYPLYQFLFYANNKTINARLNTSSVTQSNSYRSSDQIVKAKSQFSPIKLSTIHGFFVFSSSIVEVCPNTCSNSHSVSLTTSTDALKDILIRYFTKQHLVKKAISFLNILQSQIVEIFTKIDQFKKKNRTPLKYQCKIDIFFIDDIKAQGDFYNGSILLNEKTISRGVIDRRLYFLLCRAFVGMGMLNKKHDHNLLHLQGVLKLNELTLQIFPQCSDYIFVKNKEYQNVRAYCVALLKTIEQNRQNNKIFLTQQQEKQNDMQYWILEYYQKECRYFVRDFAKFEAQISSNVKNALQNLHKLEPEQYWTFFIARYPFIEFNVSQVLIKLALKQKGVPTSEAELKYAKDNFIKSKYYIKFFTKKQIQDDLKKFIQLQTHGIQKVLPFIKIKQGFLTSIPQRLQAYLYVKQNRLDSKKLYEQFKKYNQSNNFHHISALRRQMKRIRLLARDTIQLQRKDIQCGLMGWKLLHKLSIFPQDEQAFQLVTKLQKIKGKKHIIRLNSSIIEAEEQAIKLQKLLEQSDK